MTVQDVLDKPKVKPVIKLPSLEEFDNSISVNPSVKTDTTQAGKGTFKINLPTLETQSDEEKQLKEEWEAKPLFGKDSKWRANQTKSLLSMKAGLQHGLADIQDLGNILSAIGDVAKSPEEEVNPEDAMIASEVMRGKARETLKKSQDIYTENDISSVAGWMPLAASMAASAVAAPLTGGTSLSFIPALISGTTMAAFAVDAYGNSEMETEEYDKMTGHETPEFQKKAVSLTSGLVMYLAGNIAGVGIKGTNTLFKSVGDAASAAFRENPKVATDILSRYLADTPGAAKKFLDLAGTIGKDAAKTGATFGVMTMVQEMAANLNKYPEDKLALQEIAVNTLKSARDGAILGTFLGGVRAGQTSAYHNMRLKTQGATLIQTADGKVYEQMGNHPTDPTKVKVMDGQFNLKDISKQDIVDQVSMTKPEIDVALDAFKNNQDALPEIEKGIYTNNAKRTLIDLTKQVAELHPKTGQPMSVNTIRDKEGNLYYQTRTQELGDGTYVYLQKIQRNPTTGQYDVIGNLEPNPVDGKPMVKMVRIADREGNPVDGWTPEASLAPDQFVQMGVDAYKAKKGWLPNLPSGNLTEPIQPGQEPIGPDGKPLDIPKERQPGSEIEYQGRQWIISELTPKGEIIAEEKKADGNLGETITIPVDQIENIGIPPVDPALLAKEAERVQAETEPTYAKDGIPKSKAYIKGRISIAKKPEDLNGLTWTNDPDLDALVQKIFPEVVTSYKIGKETVERDEIDGRIDGATDANDLKGVVVTKDPEMEAKLAEKLLLLTSGKVPIQITPATEVVSSESGQEVAQSQGGAPPVSTIPEAKSEVVPDANIPIETPEDDINKQVEAIKPLPAEGGKKTPDQISTEIKKESDQVEPRPSESQKIAGNQKKGHVAMLGLNISIETAAGGLRTGTDALGKKWSRMMNQNYGHILGTEAADGEPLDVFLGETYESNKIFIIDQVKKNNHIFDEAKVLLGFKNVADAANAYLSNYEHGWTGMGNISETDINSFKEWVKNGKEKRPYKTSGTWIKVYPGISSMVANEGEMPKPEEQGILSLRSEGNKGVRGMGEQFSEVSGRDGTKTETKPNTGKDRQQQGLLQGELPVGDTKGAGTQPEELANGKIQGEGSLVDRPLGNIKNRQTDNKGKDTTVQMDTGNGNINTSGTKEINIKDVNIQGKNKTNGNLGENITNKPQHSQEQDINSQMASKGSLRDFNKPEEKPLSKKAKEENDRAQKAFKKASRAKRGQIFSSTSRSGIATNKVPNDFTEAVLQFFVGQRKIKTQNFIDHTGYKRGTKDLNAYFGLHSTEGVSLDTFHEKLENAFEFSDGGESMDMINKIIDIMQSYPSRGKMLTELERRQGMPERPEPSEEEMMADILPEANIETVLSDDISEALELILSDKQVMDIFIGAAYINEDGSIDWARLERHIESDPTDFTDFPYNLTDTEFQTLIDLTNDTEKQGAFKNEFKRRYRFESEMQRYIPRTGTTPDQERASRESEKEPGKQPEEVIPKKPGERFSPIEKLLDMTGKEIVWEWEEPGYEVDKMVGVNNQKIAELNKARRETRKKDEKTKIDEQIAELKDESARLHNELESEYQERNEKIKEWGIEEAKKRGIILDENNEDDDYFFGDLMVDIFERPGREHTWDMKFSEIFDENFNYWVKNKMFSQQKEQPVEEVKTPRGFENIPLGTKITSTLRDYKQTYTLTDVEGYKMFIGDKDGLPLQDGGTVLSEKTIMNIWGKEIQPKEVKPVEPSVEIITGNDVIRNKVTEVLSRESMHPLKDDISYGGLNVYYDKNNNIVFIGNFQDASFDLTPFQNSIFAIETKFSDLGFLRLNKELSYNYNEEIAKQISDAITTEGPPVDKVVDKPTFALADEEAVLEWLAGSEHSDYISYEWDGQTLEIFKSRDEAVIELTRDQLIEMGADLKPMKAPKGYYEDEGPSLDLISKAQKLSEFKQGDKVRDIYLDKVLTIKKLNIQGLSQLEDEFGRISDINTLNNTRYILEEASPVEKPDFAGSLFGKEEVPAPAEKPKEPWQMDRGEFVSDYLAKSGEKVGFNGLVKRGSQTFGRHKSDNRVKFATERHKDAIREAMAEGKTIPEEVLSLYPDLKAEIAKPQFAGEILKPPVKETPTAEKSIEKTDKGIKFGDVTYTDVDQVQDDYTNGMITLDESKQLLEDVREFEGRQDLPLIEKEVTELDDKEDEPPDKPLTDKEAKQEKLEFDEADKLISNIGPVKDFGEKIGGARKDEAESGFTRGKGSKKSKEPAWMSGFKIHLLEGDNGKYRPMKTHGNFIIWKSKDTFDTQEEALQRIKLIVITSKFKIGKIGNPKEDTSVHVYRKVSDRKRYSMKGGFATDQDAMKWMLEHQEYLLNYKPSFPVRPHIEKIDRTGTPARQGSVTTKQFADRFGFTGGEFGNWVPQDERQRILDMAFDGLSDLADVLKVPYKALSLNGQLSIAFGARGQGLSGAQAHYEPGRAVFNLTRMKGAGAVAHEWFHALDHYFGRATRGLTTGKQPGEPYGEKEQGFFMSNIAKHYQDKSRPELKVAFNNLLDGIMKQPKIFEVSVDWYAKRVNHLKDDLLYEINDARAWMTRGKEYGRKKPPATPEQLAAFDKIVDRIKEGDYGDIVKYQTKEKGFIKGEGNIERETYSTINDLNEIVKKVLGQSYLTKDSKFVRATGKIRSISAAQKDVEKFTLDNKEERSTPTRFFYDAKDLDKMRVSDYWTTNPEMMARAFEAFVEDQINAKGDISQYLVHSTDNANYKDPLFGDQRPYPDGDERIKFNELFQKFFNTVLATEKPGGNVELNEPRSIYNESNLKQAQLDIVLSSNPMLDSYHTGIRSIDNIKTAEEVFSESIKNNEDATPDFTLDDMKLALETKSVTVYSSLPIKNGVFVSPSKMQAEAYSGDKKIYSKEVNISDVAWIDQFEGQYANVSQVKEPRSTYKSLDGDEIGITSLLREPGEQMQLFPIVEPKPEAPSQFAGEQLNRNKPSQRKLAGDEMSLVENKYTLEKYLSYSGSVEIRSESDVAFIFKALQTAKNENVFVMGVIDGKPIIVHISVGTPTASVVDFQAIADFVSRFNPTELYFVHNHPSGKLDPSPQDTRIFNLLQESYGDRLSKLVAIIIDIKSGMYSLFGSAGTYDVSSYPTYGYGQEAKAQQNIYGVEEPVTKRALKQHKVYRFDKRVFKEDVTWEQMEGSKINSAEKAAQIISAQRFSTGKKLSALITDNANHVIANVHLGQSELSETLIPELIAYSGRFGGNGVIIYGNIGSVTQRNIALTEVIETIHKKLKKADVVLMDVLHIDHTPDITPGIDRNITPDYRSAADEYMIPMANEPKSPYGKLPEGLDVVNGFYSPIEKRLLDFKQDMASVNKWKEIIGKGDEAIFTGVMDWLNSLRPNEILPKNKIYQWMRDNRIEIKEIIAGGKGNYGKLYPTKKRTTQHSIDITPYMIDEVNQGQSLMEPEAPYYNKEQRAMYEKIEKLKEKIAQIWHDKEVKRQAISNRIDLFSSLDVPIETKRLQPQKGKPHVFAGELLDNDRPVKLDNSQDNINIILEAYDGEVMRIQAEIEKLQKALNSSIEISKGQGTLFEPPAKYKPFAGEYLSQRNPPPVVNEPKPLFAGEHLARAGDIYSDKTITKRNWNETVTGIREYIQDMSLPVRKFEDEILKRGGLQPNDSKPYRDMSLAFGRQETLYKDFTKTKMKPIIETVVKIIRDGMPGENILPYIISKHAIERNRVFRARELDEFMNKSSENDPTQAEIDEFIHSIANKDYSGVKSFDVENEFDSPDELAQTIVDEFEAVVPYPLVSELWDNIRSASTSTLDTWVASQKISPEQKEEYLEQFRYFVPLRGWREGAAKNLSYTKGEGFSNSLIHAEGRKSLADNPLAYMQKVAFQAIGEQVDNEVKNSMLKLIMRNLSNPDIYDLVTVKKLYYVKIELPDGSVEWEPTIDRPEQELFDSGDAKIKIYDEYHQLRTPKMASEHEVIARRQIGDVVMIFKDKMLSVAQAMNKRNFMYHSMFGKISDARTMNQAVTGLAAMNNYLKAIYTSWNIVFPFTNFMRDFQEASITQLIKGDAGHKVMANYHRSFPSIIRFLRDRLDMNNPDDVKLRDFYVVGGATGFTHLLSAEDLEKNLMDDINRMVGRGTVRGELKQFAHEIVHIISMWNQVFEDATRFSVYLTSIDLGKTKEEAASDAKEASVNFNRKGKSSKLWDSIYAFWNVALQSLQKNFRLAKDYPVAFAKFAASFMALGFLEALLNKSTDDDDPENDYYNINPYMRENYLLLPNLPRIISGKSKGDKYLSIPLPQFWRGFKSIGSLAYDLTQGRVTVKEAISRAMMNFGTAMLPVDIGGFGKTGEFSLAPIMPTVIKPFHELATNRNYMGFTIAKEPFSKAQEKLLANARLGKDNVNPAAKFFTDMLFRWGGGDNATKYYTSKTGEEKKVPGFLNINPSWIEHLFKGYTGGSGAVFSDLITTISQVIKPDEQVDFKNVPFVNRFIRKTPEAKWNIISDYYNLKSDVTVHKVLKREYTKQAEAGQGTEQIQATEGSSFYEEYQDIFDGYDKSINEISDEVDFSDIEGTKPVYELMQQAINDIKALKVKYKK